MLNEIKFLQNLLYKVTNFLLQKIIAVRDTHINVYVSIYKSVNWLFGILLRFFFKKKRVVLLDY